MGLIVINSLLIFVQEFDVSGHFLSLFETVFTLFFIVELSVKLHYYGIKKYLSSGWNKFDFIIIVISVPSLGSLFTEDLPVTILCLHA